MKKQQLYKELLYELKLDQMDCFGKVTNILYRNVVEMRKVRYLLKKYLKELK